jgi:type 1 glutamine amidotransferase
MDLASLRDPKLSSAPGEKVHDVYPLAWRYENDGGRRFYTSLGHKIEHYSDPIFRNHLRGAIRWVLRLDDTPIQIVQP